MSLSASELPKKTVGRYSDGNGLIFRVTKGKTRDWWLRVQRRGNRKEYPLGKYPELSLSQARGKAREWRELVKQGHDPRNLKGVPTFRELAEEHIETKLANKALRTVKQWKSNFETYVYPYIGDKDVDKIFRWDIEKLLLQRVDNGIFWLDKHVTADRVRVRITRVLQRGVDHDHCSKNVASGVISDLPDVKHVPRHHPMMPLEHVSEFFKHLRVNGKTDSLTRLAIEFGCLTVARSAEVRNARWEEISGDVWTLGVERTKQREINDIFLSDRAMEILEEARKIANGPYIFWSRNAQPKSDNTLNKSVKEQYLTRFCDAEGDTPVFHGLRATFKTWAEEYEVPFSERVIEAMQGHKREKSRVRAAYNRARYVDQRRRAAQLWCDFVMGRR